MDCIMCGEALGKGKLCDACTEYTLEYLHPNQVTPVEEEEA
jgi:hypothetical protein